MKTLRKLILAIPAGIPSTIAIAVILYLSLSNDPVPASFPLFPGADKVVHFFLYAIACSVFLYDYAKYKFPHHTTTERELFIMCLTMLFGLIMEGCQLKFTETRCFEVNDILANSAGAFAAYLLLHYWLLHDIRCFISGKRHRRHRRRGRKLTWGWNKYE